MDSQQIIDKRRDLVAARVINEMVLGDIHLGFEWAAMEPDDTDERVFTHLDRLNRLQSDRAPPQILDLGCAHGNRLLRYAQVNAVCVGVDAIDTSATINGFNKTLVAQHKPPITLIQSDVRKLEADDFAANSFAVINCSQVLHFMDKDDIIHMLQFIKKIAGPNTLICISLDTVDATSSLDYFREFIKMTWQERLRILDVMGYKPTSDLKYRSYSPLDLAVAMESLGLHVHGMKTVQSGLTTAYASTNNDRLFELPVKPPVTLMNGIKSYFNLQR